MPDPNITSVSVTFDPGTLGHEFQWQPGVFPLSLPAVSNGTSMYALVFTLDAPNAPGAKWPADAMDWVDQRSPPSVPGTANIPSGDDTHLVVGIDNNNAGNQPLTFGFKVRVEFDNLVFTSADPEVVLQPPS